MDIAEAGLRAADPYPNVREMLRIEEGKLIVGHKRFASGSTVNERLPLIFDLSRIGSIYLLGGGKAVQRMAQAAEDVLGDLVTDGQINAKKGEPRRCRRVNVTFAGHPIPDEDGIEGARRKHELEKKLKKGDIVFYFVSGGGSATLSWPAPGLTLKDIQDLTRLLYFEKGASMPEKNRVLGKLRMPRTGVIGDVPVIVVRSSETPPASRVLHRRFPSDDAIDILKRYELWDKVPQHVRSHLEKVHADPRYDAYSMPIHSCFTYRVLYEFTVMGPQYMLEAAKKRAEELGINAHILCSSLNDIEIGPIAGALANMACEVEQHGRPFRPPCVMIFGGEPTVTTGETAGKGGRNQEFALSTAPWIEGSENITALSVDADGTDGPTDAAGGIVDGYTMKRAEETGLDIFKELSTHNSYGVLTRLGDAVFTGVLGQNLRSLSMIHIKKTNL